MELTESRWVIDAWAVLDGLAFASSKSPDGNREEIVALQPPYWSPVPVTSIATARAARHRGFQDGLFGADGEEIVFDDLEDVIEVVRRGYLSGGIDPGREGEPSLNPPSSPDGIDVPGDTVERFLKMYDRRDDHARRQLFLGIYEAMEDAILGACCEMADSAITQLHHDADSRRIAISTACVRRCAAIPYGGRNLAERYYRRDWWWAFDAAEPDGLLWEIPLPSHIRTHVTTVGDAIMASSCSVDFVEAALGSPNTAFAFLFAHAFHAAGASPATMSVNADFGVRVAEAIVRSLPSVLPRTHPAAVELEKHVSRVLRDGGRALRKSIRHDGNGKSKLRPLT